MAFLDDEFWDLIKQTLFKMLEPHNRSFFTIQNSDGMHKQADLIINEIMSIKNRIMAKLGMDPKQLTEQVKATSSYMKETGHLQRQH